MKLRIAGIVDDSVVDGEGVRLAVFCQGCSHHCDGCHNPQTWDKNGGRLVEVGSIIAQYEANPMLQGITITGGEPFEQPPTALLALIRAVHKRGGDVWMYSGYTLEELVDMPDYQDVLVSTDVLVDGPFEQDKLCPDERFKGSRNQRVLRSDSVNKAVTDWFLMAKLFDKI